MTERETMLGRIRRSLGVTGGEVSRNAAVDDRLRRPPRGVTPARARLASAEERTALFVAMAQKVFATVARVGSNDDVPAAVAGHLRGHNLPASIRMGDDRGLQSMPWQQTALAVTIGPSDGSDPVGISLAIAGVAETGTAVLASGPDNPTTLAFLPATHIIVVRAGDIVGDYESAWAMVRQRYGRGMMPRTVNWITGPSRSADIEQTLLLGAHGPQRLHLVVVG